MTQPLPGQRQRMHSIGWVVCQSPASFCDWRNTVCPKCGDVAGPVPAHPRPPSSLKTHSKASSFRFHFRASDAHASCFVTHARDFQSLNNGVTSSKMIIIYKDPYMDHNILCREINAKMPILKLCFG